MEECAEERAYQWKEKRMRIEEEMEKRWESERHHEKRMHGMFMSTFPPMPVPFPAPTEDPNTPSTSGSDNNPPTTSGK